MDAIVKAKSLLDGFQGFKHAGEGVDSPASRLIQGLLVKFSNEASWVIRGGEELAGALELVAVNVTRVVQKWGDGQPIQTRVLEPGEKFPNLEKQQGTTPTRSPIASRK